MLVYQRARGYSKPMPWLHHQPLTLSEGPNTPRHCRCRGPRSPPRRRRRAPQRLLRASLKRRVKENIVTTMLAYDVHWLPCVFSFEWFEMVIFQWCIKIFTFDWNSDLIDTNTCMESRPFVIWSCSLEKLSFSCRCVNPRVNGKRKQENEDSKGVGWTCEHPKKIHSLLAKKTFHGQQKRLLHLHLQKVKINIYIWGWVKTNYHILGNKLP